MSGVDRLLSFGGVSWGEPDQQLSAHASQSGDDNDVFEGDGGSFHGVQRARQRFSERRVSSWQIVETLCTSVSEGKIMYSAMAP